jgi:hypothetical protein
LPPSTRATRSGRNEIRCVAARQDQAPARRLGR